MKPNSSRALRFFITLALTVTIFLVLFRRVDPKGALETIRMAHPAYILLAMLFTILFHTLLTSERWRLLLEPLGCVISFRESFFIKMGSFPLKSLLPFRFGELVKVIYLRNLHGTPIVRSFATIVAEYGLNAAMLLLLILAGCFLYGENPYNLVRMSAAGLSAIGVFVLLTQLPLVRRGVKRLLAMLPEGRLRSALSDMGTYYRPVEPRWASWITLHTALINGARILIFICILRALRIEIPFSSVFIFLPMVTLIASLPVTLMGLGTREASIIFFFSSAAPSRDLLSAGLLLSLMENLVPLAIGLIFTRSFLSRVIEGAGEGVEEPSRPGSLEPETGADLDEIG